MEKFRLEKLNETRQEAKKNGQKLDIVIDVYFGDSVLSTIQLSCTSITFSERLVFLWKDDRVSCNFYKEIFKLTYSFCDCSTIFYNLNL